MLSLPFLPMLSPWRPLPEIPALCSVFHADTRRVWSKIISLPPFSSSHSPGRPEVSILRPRRVFSLFLVTRAHGFSPTIEEKKKQEKKHEMQRSAQPCVCAIGRQNQDKTQRCKRTQTMDAHPILYIHIHKQKMHK